MTDARTIDDIHRRYATGEATPSQICQAALDRVEQQNGRLNALLTVTRDEALAAAAAMDSTIQELLDRQPLAGIPIVIKDNLCTAGIRTTCGSRMLADYAPPYSATVVRQLEAAGAILIGKANLDEYAMGGSTENSAYGPSRNPWNDDCVPGGSSGGSAVAVASGMVPVSLGSDTGGSIRQPASFCGLVGLKPTYGRVSRYGLVAFASSLDQIGPFAWTVRDAARLLGVIAGHDPHDATSAHVPVPDYLASLTGDLTGIRIGVPPECFGEGLDPEVRAHVEAGIERLAARGASIVEVHLPHMRHVIAVYYIIATAEASSNLARFDGVRYGYRTSDARSLSEMYRRTRDEGFGAEVKRRIMLGTFVLSSGYYDAYYEKAQRVRAMLGDDFRQAFASCDAIVTPTAPTPPFRIGEKSAGPLEMYLGDIYTVTVNLAGLPAINVPCGLSRAGLPIGMQLIGSSFDEVRLLNIASVAEPDVPLVPPSLTSSPTA